MKTMYQTTMTNIGGRSGEVFDPERAFVLKIAPPGGGEAGATNPEQLFAAGYSACFNGALSLVLKRERIEAQSQVSVTVTLYERAPFDYLIGVSIEGHIEGVSLEQAEQLLEKAHHVCPYSKATEGNIEVSIKAI